MAHRGDLLLIVGTVFCGFALIFLLIGFSTPNWLELDKNYITKGGFRKLGLWEACFHDYTHYKDFSGKIYKGCWWIFSEEYRPIWDYINPPWFLGIQIMMTIVLVVQKILVLAGIMMLIKCCPGRQSFIGLVVFGAMAVVSGILTAICVIIFGSKSVSDNNWIEMPEKNFVSWSFGCVVFSGFLVLFGGVSMIVAGLYARLMNHYDERSTAYTTATEEYQLEEKHENHQLHSQNHEDIQRLPPVNKYENGRHQSHSNHENHRSRSQSEDKRENHQRHSSQNHRLSSVDKYENRENRRHQSRSSRDNLRHQSNHNQENRRSNSHYNSENHRHQKYDQENYNYRNPRR